MNRYFAPRLLLLVIATSAYGQSGLQEPAFEVASVRPATDRDSPLVKSNEGHYRCVCSLGTMIRQAYSVGREVVAPDWIDDYGRRYVVDAKLPVGSGQKQIPGMLQRLLASRFHLSVHRENRETPVYALVVDKDGLKVGLRSVPADAPRVPTEPQIHAVTNQSDGRIYLEGAITLTQLANYLYAFMDRAVLNLTGKDGEFDIKLNARIPPNLLRPLAGGLFMLTNGKTLSTGSAMDTPARDIVLWDGRKLPGEAPSIFQELRKFGLRLDATKAPVTYLVVDKADQVPTVN